MNTKNFLISVIIPIYGVEKYIERCAVSLFEQTLTEEIEFIFVNDCTPDNSMEILNRVLDKYPNRKESTKIVNHKENQGLAAARMTGFNESSGDYVIHCDSDDWAEKDMYEILLSKALSTGADIVSCGYFSEEPGNTEIKLFDYEYETHEIINKTYPDLLYCAVWNKLIRRELYTNNNIEWFDGINMYEDVGITTRLRAYSKKTVILNHPLYHYNRTNTNSMGRSPSIRSIEEQIECARLLNEWHNSAKNINISDFLKKVSFYSKIGLVIFRSSFNPNKWRTLYSDTDSLIWTLNKLPFYNKIALYLVKLKLDWVAYFLIYLKSRFTYKG